MSWYWTPMKWYCKLHIWLNGTINIQWSTAINVQSTTFTVTSLQQRPLSTISCCRLYLHNLAFFFLIFVKTLLTKIIFYFRITHTFLYTTCIVFFSRGRNKQVQILLSSESEISHKQTSNTLSLFYYPVLHNVRLMLPNWWYLSYTWLPICFYTLYTSV